MQYVFLLCLRTFEEGIVRTLNWPCARSLPLIQEIRRSASTQTYSLDFTKSFPLFEITFKTNTNNKLMRDNVETERGKKIKYPRVIIDHPGSLKKKESKKYIYIKVSYNII